MEYPSIVTVSEEEARLGELSKKIRQFNYKTVGEYPEAIPIRLNAKDSSGNNVGGIRGFIFMQWLNIDILFVDESHRKARLRGIRPYR